MYVCMYVCMYVYIYIYIYMSYATDPDGQATYHDGHKIAFSLWQKLIRTVESQILPIKTLL